MTVKRICRAHVCVFPPNYLWVFKIRTDLSPDIEYQSCTGEPGESTTVTQFQEFSRLELPRLVRRTLESVVEQEAQPLEDKLKERLVDIVKECQTQLVRMFQATAGPVPLASTIPQNTAQKNASCNELHVFEGFDSLPVRAARVPGVSIIRANDPTENSNPVAESASGSLDSGYASTWLSAMPTHPHEPANMGIDVNFTPAINESGYMQLGGYYGLFETRTGGIEPAMAINADIIPSAGWSFMEPLHSTGNAMGLGSLDELGPEWHLGEDTQ